MKTTKFTLERQTDSEIIESAYLLGEDGQAIDTIYCSTADGVSTYSSYSGKDYEWDDLQVTD